MSAGSDEEPTKVPGLVPLGMDSQGRVMLGMPYNESLVEAAVEKGLAHKTTTPLEPAPEEREGETPEPGGDAEELAVKGGPIRRFNDVFTNLGSVQLEALALDGHEIAKATSKFRDELYRSKFPIVVPRFGVKCVSEGCGAEYERDLDFCLECARREMAREGHDHPPTDPDEIPEEYRDHPVRDPSPTEKREAKQMVESVNKEGQSLRGLMEMAEDDQSRLGVSVIITKKQYAVARGDFGVYSEGDIIWEGADELVKGDPKRVVPVVDDNGRVGGWWWTCPIHRGDALTEQEDYMEGARRCGHCNAELREVFFVETAGPRTRSYQKSAEKYYFQDEVVTWARYFPRLNGLDGLSPAHHIWIKQAVLHWMDIYGAAFYDPDSERYPNKFIVVHTTNPKAWERQFEKAEEERQDNPYTEQILYNEYSGEAQSTPEVQVVDLMSENLVGQEQQIRDQFKQDIRNHYGVTNIFESELKDAGGLNNEGLQLEVTDRNIASAMRDLVAGPLDELAKRLGLDDHAFEFIPPAEATAEDLETEIRVGQDAAGAGLEARLEDGRAVVEDGEFEEAEDDDGGLGALFGADFSEKADPLTEGHHLAADGGALLCEAEGASFVLDDIGKGDACPHCGGPVSVFGKADGGGDEGGERPWRTEGTERTPARSAGEGEDGRSRHGEKAAGPVRFGNVGGDPMETQEGLEAFAADLEAAGAEVLLGEEPWEHAEGIHDRPVVAYGITLEDAESVWADHEENALALGDPRLSEKSGEDEEGNADRGGTFKGVYYSDEEDRREKLKLVGALDDAFEHIIWADAGAEAAQKSFWGGSDDVPAFVKEALAAVVTESLWDDFALIPGVVGRQMADMFEEQLTQPQGWSLRSITGNLAEAFGVSEDDARVVARSETAKVLNDARREGYRRLDALDEDFHWKGPDDEDTTECCKWLGQVTGWDSGTDMISKHGRPQAVDTVGEPVTYGELVALQREATQKFFPHLQFRENLPHPQCRRTFSQTFL